jgi:tRNA A-37 threonylcarbamoyl transferase component Bud32
VTHDLTRENLAERTEEVLNRGSARNPDVLLVRSDAGYAVVKDFAPRRWLVRQTLGRWLTRREMRAYRALAGHPNVPRLLGEIDALAFALEYRAGRRLTRSAFKILPNGFAGNLRDAIEGLHERGVAHLDLSHRSNVLVSDESREPVLIDFGSAVCFEPGGVAARVLLPWLARLDQRALRKWRAKMERRRT